MNKQEIELLKTILQNKQEDLGCQEENRGIAMIEYDRIDSIIKKLRLYA